MKEFIYIVHQDIHFPSGDGDGESSRTHHHHQYSRRSKVERTNSINRRDRRWWIGAIHFSFCFYAIAHQPIFSHV